MSGTTIKSRHDDMKLRINARCKDLLEVTRIIDPTGYHLSGDPSDRSREEYLQPSFLDYQVDFLHRTVRDFFHLRRIHDWIKARISKGFNYNQSLCAAFLAQIKTVLLNPQTNSDHQILSGLSISMVKLANRIETQTGVPSTALLDSLISVFAHDDTSMTVSRMSFLGDDSFDFRKGLELITKTEMLKEPDVSTSLLRYAPLAFAVHHDLRLYVAEKLDDRWNHISLYREDTALTYAALTSCGCTSNDHYTGACSHKMLNLVVSKGAKFRWSQCHWYPLREACIEVYLSWADMADNLTSVQSDQLEDPQTLHWVLCVLSSLENWRRYYLVKTKLPSDPDLKLFEEKLTNTTEKVLQRGVNPNWKCGKITLWIYFVVCLFRDYFSESVYPKSSRLRMLRLAKKFVVCGAVLDQDVSIAIDELVRDKTNTDIPWDRSVQVGDEKFTAHDVLKGVFLEEEWDKVVHGNVADSQGRAQSVSQRKIKLKERKKRRKERKQAKQSH